MLFFGLPSWWSASPTLPSSQKPAGKGRQETWECSLWCTWRMPVRLSSFLSFLLRYTVLHSGHQELEKLPIHNDPESLESCFWLRTWLTTKPFIPIHVCMNRTPWHLSWPSSPPERHGPWGQGPREGTWMTGLDGTQGRAWRTSELRRGFRCHQMQASSPHRSGVLHCVLEAGQSLLVYLQGQELTPS